MESEGSVLEARQSPVEKHEQVTRDAQLNEQETEAASRRMNENELSRLDLVRLLDEREGGQALQEDGSGVASRGTLRKLDELVGGSNAVVCETAAGRVGLRAQVSAVRLSWGELFRLVCTRKASFDSQQPCHRP